MQTTPSSITSTVKETQPGSGKVSRRRLFFLAATAAVASGLGIALGGTLRFQAVPVGQVPLFKPQQDFPPLAEWPPEVPSAEHHEFDTRWEDEVSSPQLIYNDRLSTELESHEANEDDFNSAQYAFEEPLVAEEIPSPMPADFVEEDGTQDATNMGLAEETLPPVISTNTEELDNKADFSPPQVDDDTASSTDISPRFNKQPASELQFTDGPVIISPEESIPSPDVLSD